MASLSNKAAYLLIIIIACQCKYTESRPIPSEIVFMEEPQTNKDCYIKGERGTLKATFCVENTTPLDQYMVALNTNQQGGGKWLYNGTTSLFYKDIANREEHDRRFILTCSYVSRTVNYELVIDPLENHDETPPFYILIIDRLSSHIVKASAVGAQFTVSKYCEPLSAPTKQTSPVRDESTPQIHVPTMYSPITTGSNNDFSTVSAKGRHLRPCGLLIGMLAGLCIIFYM